MLNEKQQRFADEYLIDLNATQAAIRAGYSEKTARVQGSRLLLNADIKSYIEERMASQEEDTIASADEVMRYLTSVIRGKSRSHVLARDELGAEHIVEKPPDEKERLKAAELMGKRHQLFTDKVKVDGNMPVMIVDDLDG
jgi:phage terminase small subunit